MADTKEKKKDDKPRSDSSDRGPSTSTESKSGKPVAAKPTGAKAEPKKSGKRKTVSFVGKDAPGNKRRRGPARAKSEFDQSIISIRRVTRVVAGGRRFSFSVSMVVGDKKGRVGIGMGKSSDTALAIEKAARQGKKMMITVPLNKDRSIRHEVEAKFCASRVIIKPAPGKGLSAGSSVRVVLSLAGITDVNAKVLSRSKSKFNTAKAAINALKKIRS